MVAGPVTAELAQEDRDYLAEAVRIAEGLDWSANPWGQLTDALKAATDRRGKALFLPLRRALTGLDHGPEMAAMLPLIGRDRAVERLRAATG